MRPLTEFAGVVERVDARGNWIRYRHGEILCRGAELPVGSRVRFTCASDSGGEFARVAGAKGNFGYDNSDLTWSGSGGGGKWSVWSRIDW